MPKTVISVVFVDNFLFQERSQSDIDNVMNYFKDYGTSYNWEHSNGELVYDFLGIDIKTQYDDRFQFCQNGLIRKFLEATCMENCNELPTPTKVEAPLGTDVNGSEDKRDWNK